MRMIELLFQTMKEKRLHVLNALRAPHMIFSHEQEFVSLKLIGCSPFSQMLYFLKFSPGRTLGIELSQTEISQISQILY